MSETVIASNGRAIPIGDLAQIIGYDGDNPITFTLVYQAVTYVQTLTYDGANVINISQWVAQ
jgi:hypothetical protein